MGQAVSLADRTMSEYRRKLPHFHPELDCHSPGPKWLKDPRIANLVAHAVMIGEAERHFYEFSAWVVMPNHVHLLILPLVPVSVLMR